VRCRKPSLSTLHAIGFRIWGFFCRQLTFSCFFYFIYIFFLQHFTCSWGKVENFGVRDFSLLQTFFPPF
jgi:hypothetical protein